MKHTVIDVARCQNFIRSAVTVQVWLADWQKRAGAPICNTVLGEGKAADLLTLVSVQVALLKADYSKNNTLISFDLDDEEDVADVGPVLVELPDSEL